MTYKEQYEQKIERVTPLLKQLLDPECSDERAEEILLTQTMEEVRVFQVIMCLGRWYMYECYNTSLDSPEEEYKVWDEIEVAREENEVLKDEVAYIFDHSSWREHIKTGLRVLKIDIGINYDDYYEDDGYDEDDDEWFGYDSSYEESIPEVCRGCPFAGQQCNACLHD